jgi:undecaprenyl-diphosphatase
MKPFFARLRPCHVPEFQHILNLPDGCGGRFGMDSSHAANTVGLAMFLLLTLGKQYKFIGLMFVWAIFVSFSRVYLAAHYFTDIFVGGLVGILSAWVVAKIPEKVFRL